MTPGPVLEKTVPPEQLEQYFAPLRNGWRREIRYRKTIPLARKEADVYYFDPKGVRFRSLPAIEEHLRKSGDTNYTVKNFCTSIMILGFNEKPDVEIVTNVGPSSGPVGRKRTGAVDCESAVPKKIMSATEVSRSSSSSAILPTNTVSEQSPTPNETALEVVGNGRYVDIIVRNVTCTFHVGCHINLREAARKLCNVYYDGKRTMKKLLRKPRAHATIWSTGKVRLAGCHDLKDAKLASRVVARLLQKIIGPKVKLFSYRMGTVMATSRLPFGVRIGQMARDFPGDCSYEPELCPGLIWKSTEPKMTFTVHSTGSVTMTGVRAIEDIENAYSELYSILLHYKCPLPPQRKRGPKKNRVNAVQEIGDGDENS